MGVIMRRFRSFNHSAHKRVRSFVSEKVSRLSSAKMTRGLKWSHPVASGTCCLAFDQPAQILRLLASLIKTDVGHLLFTHTTHHS